MGFLKEFYEILMGFLCGSYAISMLYLDLSMGFLWDSYGVSMIFLSYSQSIPMTFLWDSDFYGTSMIFLEDFFGNSVGFP